MKLGIEGLPNMEQKKLGLPSIIATGVGLIVATSCLLSIGQGSAAIGTPFIITMAIACAFNILTALSICELNALMPNLTGGMAQYTLACLGPFVSIVITVKMQVVEEDRVQADRVKYDKSVNFFKVG